MPLAEMLTDARKSPRQARSRAMVDLILDATARVLVEDGYARASTNRVAERAGISVGSLYQYFPSREALVSAVGRRHTDRLKSSLESTLVQNDHLDLRTAITRVLQALSMARAVDPELNRVLAEELPRFGSLDWKAEATARNCALARHLFDSHRDEIREGLQEEAAAFLVATLVEAAMNGAYREEGRALTPLTLERELTEMILRHIGKGEGEKRAASKRSDVIRGSTSRKEIPNELKLDSPSRLQKGKPVTTRPPASA
jgi:AcrR family transcriptional regulator